MKIGVVGTSFLTSGAYFFTVYTRFNAFEPDHAFYRSDMIFLRPLPNRWVQDAPVALVGPYKDVDFRLNSSTAKRRLQDAALPPRTNKMSLLPSVVFLQRVLPAEEVPPLWAEKRYLPFPRTRGCPDMLDTGCQSRVNVRVVTVPGFSRLTDGCIVSAVATPA